MVELECGILSDLFFEDGATRGMSRVVTMTREPLHSDFLSSISEIFVRGASFSRQSWLRLRNWGWMINIGCLFLLDLAGLHQLKTDALLVNRGIFLATRCSRSNHKVFLYYLP